MLKINGYNVDVNYSDELETHIDRFYKMRIRGNKLQACSPFRYENHPSFAVNLDNGTWVDSGASDEHMRKGNFISLLAFLREESYTETSDYLLEKYTHILDDVASLKLSLDLQMSAPEVAVLGQEKYADVVGITSEYLVNRGITPEVQKYFETGQGTKGDCVALPWHDKDGRIINVKYRSIRGKDFWFSSGGQPIKNHVFGLFAVKRHNYRTVWAVESEIDCLYLWSCGIPAIAFGGASMSDKQYRLLRSSGIECLVIATDNDTVGHRFAEVLKQEFMGVFKIQRFVFPSDKKDVNDLSKHDIINAKVIDCLLHPILK